MNLTSVVKTLFRIKGTISLKYQQKYTVKQNKYFNTLWAIK